MKKKYDWKITLNKAAIVLGDIVIAGLLSYALENDFLILLVPVLEAVRNYLKHA